MSEYDFHATRWSLVLEARSRDAGGQAALSELCALYYQPVVAFLRREGRDPDAARELAHAFFESLISRGVGAPDPARGRFRSYLLGALKHFLVARRTAESAQKRGGHSEHIAWDGSEADAAPPAAHDAAFDRDWALAILAAAMTALEAEHARNPGSFRILRPWLDPSHDRPQKDAARDLGISEAALKVAIHRLRVRWREHVRTAVRATLHDPADLDDEMRHLLDILASGR
jgi:DNA-directed RNA polymerase specialized sigma24 family protein